ncbi:MAG: 2-amino-4-hydroxy-6-hydroxymethyldihydropteridine diphosphokinase [Pseudomonadota bacterium]|nr:2-amino-4-hydroxy-6-hydroxymethyldihydropteridine diphosphokinase [Pseudomonadota bacterium]
MHHKVFVGIGSNINKKENIRSCIKIIEEEFEDFNISPIYQTQSMGFKGPDFYNCVCSFLTTKDVYELKDHLSKIELDHGRHFKETKFSSRTLDIDILYFDDLVLNNEQVQIPRKEILEFDFVLLPLCDLDPDFVHPELGKKHKNIIKDIDIKKLILKKINL